MACDCISRVEKLVKAQTNESGCSKRFRKLGNIHSGIGFLMEEDNKEEEK